MPRLPVIVSRNSEFLRGPGSSTPDLLILVLIVAALYFGREIFVPIALAILLSFALWPLVSWLRRHGFPRIPAVVTVVVVAFLAIFAFGVVIAGQVTQLGSNLLRYQNNIEEKIRSLRENAPGEGMLEQASRVLRDLGEEIEKQPATPSDADDTPSPTDEEAEPIPVEIQQPEPAPLEILQNVIGPLIKPLTTGGVVIVFVIFILLQREDLRDRFIRLAGARDLQRTTQALSEAGTRVANYLLMQLVVNATYGIPVGVGLWLIGIPNPLLWGILATILRFIPYIGPIIAAMLPLALAVAVDPGWTMLLWTAGLFIVLELVSNNIIEPWLYGSTTGLSPVAIIAAAIFWTWLWGPIGLLLSTPLTVCLVVLGRHVPQFGFLDILLGSEPVLSPQESLYQRLLAGDPDEATERAEEFLEEKPLIAFYEEVAVPVLAMAERDRTRGTLDDDRRAIVAEGMLTLVDNLSEYEDPPTEAKEAEDEAAGEPVSDPPQTEPIALSEDWQERPVLCAGGRGNLDDAASAILAQLCERRGIDARIVPFEDIASSHYAKVDFSGVRVVCLSYMNATSLAHARYLVRRLRRRTRAPILVGFWSMPAEEADRRDLVKTTRADFSAISLPEALSQIMELAAGTSTAEPPAAKSSKPESKLVSLDRPRA